MSVTVILPAYLQPYADNKESVAVQGNTIRECLDELLKQYPGLTIMVFEPDGQMHTYVSIFAANEIVYSDQLDKPIKDGETIHILYVIGGG